MRQASTAALTIFLCLAACGEPPPPSDTPSTAPVTPSAETATMPSTGEPAPLNVGPTCTSDADCAELTPIAPATWACSPTRPGALAADGPAPARYCELRHATGAMYCNAVSDCPVHAASDVAITIECTADHQCLDHSTATAAATP
jgi:hypothetical protein